MEENTQSQTNNQTPPPHPLPPKLPTYSKLPEIENPLEEYLGRKAPQLPEHWRAMIAKFSPWISLIVFLLTLPAIFAIFGFSFFMLAKYSAVTGYHYSFGYWYYFTTAITAVAMVLEVIALPGLFNRTKQGWVYIFYASLIFGVANILNLNIGSLVGTLISLYFIFQIKNQYK